LLDFATSKAEPQGQLLLLDQVASTNLDRITSHIPELDNRWKARFNVLRSLMDGAA